MNRDQKLNILVLFWGRKGGGAKYTYEIAKELSEQDDVNLSLSISRQCDLFDSFLGLGCPGFHPETYETTAGFVKRWVFQRRRFLESLRQLLMEQEVDVILIGMDFFWGGIIYKAASEAGANTIYVVHEPEPHPGEPRIMSAVKRITLRTLITGADHLVALTDHVKKQLQDRFSIRESRVSVILHGIFSYHEASEPKTFPENGQVRILYFGTITFYKGLDILLKAFQILQNRNRKVSLEIWGSGEIQPYQELLQPLKNVRVENRWIDEEELEAVFRDLHLCVLPYRQVSQSGIVGAACSAAMPIVATPVQGLKEQLNSLNVRYSHDFSAEALADVIESLLDDPKGYKRMSDEMLQYAESLKWSSIAHEFRMIADSLTQKN